MMERRTVAPGFSRSLGLGACTHTSAEVVLGTVAGLTTMTLPAMSPSGPVMRAGLPVLMASASFTGTLARATICEMSTIDTIGIPGAAISPGWTGRSAAARGIGLVIGA